MLEKRTVCLSEAVNIQCQVTLTVTNGAGWTTIATSRGFRKGSDISELCRIAREVAIA